MMLRPYQSDVIRDLWNWFRRNKTGNPLLKVPTGGGKTHIMAQIIRDALSFRSQRTIRIIVVTHNTTLVNQNHSKFKLHNPNNEIDVGLNSASLGVRDINSQVLFAGIQSIYKSDDIGTFDLILVDECQYIPKTGEGMYRTFIQKQKTMNPLVRVVGLTATDYRLSSGKLTEGEQRVFDSIASEIKLSELLDLKFSVPIRYLDTFQHMRHMEGVGSANGEWNQKQAGSRMMEHEGTKTFLNDAIRIGKEYKLKKWKIYCTTLEHCEEVNSFLKRKKISSAIYSSEVSDSEKEEILNRYSTNRLKVLVSCDSLITGFDETKIDFIINLKPTKSRGRWEQLCGRGMRPHEMGTVNAKRECFLADYTTNTYFHGKADRLHLTVDSLGSHDCYIDRCNNCGMAMNLYDQNCDYCGVGFKKNRAAIYAIQTLLKDKTHQTLNKTVAIQCPREVGVKIATYQGNRVVNLFFNGYDAMEESGTPSKFILSEFLTFGIDEDLDREFYEFFTETPYPPNIFNEQDYAKELFRRFKMPLCIFTTKNRKGYNTSIGYIKEGKSFHFKKSNEEVLNKLLTDKKIVTAA